MRSVKQDGHLSLAACILGTRRYIPIIILSSLKGAAVTK